MEVPEAAAFVTVLDGPDVHMVHDGVQNTDRVILRDKVAQTRRKKKIIV